MNVPRWLYRRLGRLTAKARQKAQETEEPMHVESTRAPRTDPPAHVLPSHEVGVKERQIRESLDGVKRDLKTLDVRVKVLEAAAGVATQTYRPPKVDR